MDKEDVINYIRSQTEVQAPSLQKRFSLSYSECKDIIDRLTADGTLEYTTGVSYKVNAEPSAPPIYIPKNSTEELYIKALWECVKSGSVSLSTIQRSCAIGFSTAVSAVEWMESRGFVSPPPLRMISLGKEEFIKRFGNPDEKEAKDDNAVVERLIELRKMAAEEQKKQSDNHVSDDDDDEDDFVSIFDDDDDDDDDYGYFEDEDHHGDRGFNYDEDNDDSDTVDWKSVLMQSFELGFVDAVGEDKYIFGLDGEIDLELKFINNHGELRISDGGRTMRVVNQTKRRIANVLKPYAPVKLDNDEIAIVIDNPVGTLSALIRLYAAIHAVLNMK